jgi:MOSC domain-containing protein YiiM
MSLSCELLAVSVGLPRSVVHNGKTFETGIYKEPVEGPIRARELGLEGDGQADLSAHGGIHKAVYAYSFAHVKWWARELERDDLGFGTFGENFSVDALDEKQVHIGDVFRCGGVLLQVTQPRSPCFKLAMKLELPTLPKRFLASGRTGFYLSVLEPGEVRAGDRMERVTTDSAAVSVHAVHRLAHFERQDREGLRRAVAVQALAPEWRDSLRALLPED